MPRNSNQVKITHPGGLESEVDERSVPHWERAGWSRADATTPEAPVVPVVPVAPEAPVANPKKTTPPPRRETKEG